MKTKPNADAALRQRAEAQFKARPAAAKSPETAAGALRLKQELEIHQIELEMQNEELRAAQVEIKAGLERYTELFDFAPAGYFTLTAEGTILLVNLTGATLLGSERAHLIGKRLNVLVAEGDRKIFTGFLDRVFTGSKSETCRVWLALEGQPVRIVRLDSKRAAEGDCCRVVMLDITEHHRAEEKLHQSESELNRAQATAHVGNWRWEMRHDRVTWSPEMYRIFGVQPETFEHSLVGVNQLIHPDDLPRQAQAIEAFLQGQPFKNYEYRVIRPDKDIRVVEVISSEVKRDTSGRPILVLGTVQDITARKRAEAALQESEALYRAIYDQASDGIVLMSTAGELVALNEAFARMHGYTVAEMMGMQVKDLNTPETNRLLADRMLRFAAGEAQTFEVGHYHKDGHVFSIEVSGRRVLFGEKYYIQSICRDITERMVSEAVQSFLAQTTSGWAGGPFFNLLAGFLAKNLQMDFVCIDVLEGDGLNARTLAVWHDGKFEDNVTYALKDTPCGDVVGKQVCCFTAGVTKLFPKDQVLQDLHAESYAGVTLFDHAGKPIGLIAVISRKPLVNRAQTEAGLKMVAVRAAGELERQQAEAKMREAQNLLQAAMDHSPAGIAIADAPDGKLRYVNNAGLLIRGGDRESIVNGVGIDQYVASWQLLDLDGRPLKTEEVPLARALRFGETNRREFIIRRTDSEESIVSAIAAPIQDPGGKVVAAIVIFDDITARKRAEELHHRLSTAVEQAAETIVITDTKGTIIYANPSFERSTGYTCAEALGQNPRVLKSGKHDATFYRRMWEVLKRGDVWTGHFINQRKDGTLYEEEATISPIRDAAGKIINFVAAKRDVSREVQLERQITEIQKMEAIGQLAGGVAHDYNNILAATNIQLGMLMMDKTLKPEVLEALKDLQRGSDRAASLTRQLLLFSRRQAMQIKPVELNTLLDDVLKMIRRVIGEHIDLNIQSQTQAAWIEADSGMIEQVVMNLAINARDAMPNGGKLTIRINELVISPQDIRNPEARTDHFISLTVADEGCGMSEEIQSRIFEPFFTTKGVGKGTGLGLATVYGIVKQHRGWIEVSSKIGKGSVFQVLLPKGGSQTSVTAEHTQPPIMDGTGTILVVEDEDSVRRPLVLFLKLAGYQVFEAENGAEALKLWGGRLNLINLLLTDMVMPGGMNGKQLADSFKKSKPDLPVIITSGYSTEISNFGFNEEYGFRFLAKPYQTNALLKIVQQCLGSKK